MLVRFIKQTKNMQKEIQNLINKVKRCARDVYNELGEGVAWMCLLKSDRGGFERKRISN